MPSLVEFLNHVVKGEGYRCWFVLKKGERPQQGFSSSSEDLAGTLTSLDALGYDAYFACATYKEPVSRKAENVKFASCFWMDIDYGTDGHGQPCAYPDEDAALDAVERFCDEVGMPHPTPVYSGGGIHVYWPLSRPLTPDEWIPNAKLLKQLAAAKGLHADPTRTADIASILRPPTTRNWKLPGQPRLVECLEIVDGTIQLPATIETQPAGTTAAQSAAPRLEQKQTLDLNSAAANIYSTEREPSYASVASNQCNQLRHFRETRGNISEPLWYAGLGLLAQCEDGLQCAHEWSSGHPTYSREETDRKFNQAKAAAGATTCERFKSINPSGCVGCPFAVTSPIVLGRAKKEFAQPAAQAVETFPPMPPGYSMNQKYQLTVDKTTVDKAGVEKTFKMAFTKHPIFLTELRDSEHSTERNQGFLFRQWEPTKGWIEFEITGTEYHGQGVWGKFSYYGNSISDLEQRKAFLKYVDASIMMLKDEEKKMRYEQFGWKNDYTAFYLGSTLFKNDGTSEKAAGNGECTKRGEKMNAAKGGSLAAWTSAANRLFVDGCEAQSFGLLASFASPLMVFITPPGEGGAVLSFFSPDGGSGKTTTLTAIGSVWGEPEAIRVAGRDTINATFRAFGTNRHLPIIRDELRARHPELILEQIIGFTEGRDRNRARIDGTVNPVTHDWCNILFSASNKSVIDALNNAQKAGDDPMSNRVFEVEFKKPKDVEFSLTGELGNEFLRNHGYAGRAFLTYLLQPGMVDWVRKNIVVMADHYMNVTKAQTCHRYVIRLMAAVAIAAQICKHLGLMEFSPDRVMAWAVEQVVLLINNTYRFNPVEAFNKILCETMISDALVVNCAATSKADVMAHQTPRNEVNMRFEVNTGRLYVSAGWIKYKLTEKGQPVSSVINELRSQKILLDTKRRMVLTGGIKELLGGQVTCWEIDMNHPDMAQTYTNEVLPFKMKAV